jgi:2-oxoisovalerate dehydrogenase E1 component beta subunit
MPALRLISLNNAKPLMLDISQTATELSLVQAVNLALRRAMADDRAVLVLGEDIAIDGGVFRATEGLLALYGKDRVLDTPLAEAGIAGVSIGLAAQGFRPVAEIQFTGFAYACIDQVLNHGSRLRARTRGRLTCPMVLRAPAGGGIKAIEHHSESPEALFAHIPGLKVVIPSSPSRAYGLLLSAIRDPDPVVFLEPTRLYRAARGKVADDGVGVPLERCAVLREGRDVTLVTWGAMITETLEAAAQLAGENIEADVIDVATLKPLDAATIMDSVARTGRLIVVHEAPITCGYGAEIAARVAGSVLTSLLAPIERVAGYDTMMPYFRTEAFYMPNVEQIIAAVRRTMAYT